MTNGLAGWGWCRLTGDAEMGFAWGDGSKESRAGIGASHTDQPAFSACSRILYTH